MKSKWVGRVDAESYEGTVNETVKQKRHRKRSVKAGEKVRCLRKTEDEEKREC